MKAIAALAFALAGLCLGAPALYETSLASPQAVGNWCKAPLGEGSCQHTRNCKGISYPTGLCPKDATDVQCCVDIKCSVGSSDGFCRSKKNDGCGGGNFHTGLCPRDSDIQCCIQDPIKTLLPRASQCTLDEYDQLMYWTDMDSFQAARNAQDPGCFDWFSDDCSGKGGFDTPETPTPGADFAPSCRRHDFGYHNAQLMDIFTEAEKERIDDNFKNDMDNVCDELGLMKRLACKAAAKIYHKAVEEFGGEDDVD
ncbi:hypothetical protein LTR08_001736 [Meristemomyces frigidus]|nr:hypothetical protein LTR08_001736 [Meristemomyces frigidus]